MKNAALRARHIGFVFQSFMLVPTLTALENVQLPALLRGEGERQSREQAVTLLTQLGQRLSHLPAQLSGGPQQLERFEDWLTPQLKVDQRWYSMDESSGALNRSMERSQYFLLLSEQLTLLLSVAVAMGHYCRRRAELVTVLKTLGAGVAG